MHHIQVVNGNDHAIEERFEGRKIVFKGMKNGKGKPGELTIPLDAAKHIFGVDFPCSDDECDADELRGQIFRHLQRRWGWNVVIRKSDGTVIKDMEEVGKRAFRLIRFHPVEIKVTELVINNKKNLPLPRGDKEDIAIDEPVEISSLPAAVQSVQE